MSIGTIITDDEVLALIPGVSSIGVGEALLIKAAEEAVQKHCGRVFASTTYTDEEVDIEPGELGYAGSISVQRKNFFLAQAPVTTFTSIKQVLARSVTTGAPSETYVIPRNAYYVNMRLGIVTLVEPSYYVYSENTLLNLGAMTSWPTGKAILLCSYIAGYSVANMPSNLKAAVLMALARMLKLFSEHLLHITNSSGQLGNVTVVAEAFTSRERDMLAPLCRRRY